MKSALFFALLLLSLGAAHIQARHLSQDNNSQKKAAVANNGAIDTYDVIVVGSGMSGITTAKTLLNTTTNAAKVLILEARERSGGRLHSVQTAFGRIDLGAMWIHDGFQGNPLYDLAVQLGEPLSPEEDYTSAYIATLDGSPSNQSERIDLYISFLDNVMDRITALKSNPATNSSSMDVPLSQIYEDFVQKMNLTAKQQEATNLMAHTGFQVLLNANISKLSTLRYGDAKTLPAIDVLLKNGFDSLTDILKQGLDIKYNTPVVSIAQDTTGATVTDANGTTYRAKYVVTTQSLGCLKADMIKFDPPLPVEKLKAINEMGMGVLDKVILVYDREQVFWSPADFISREMPDLSGDWSVYLNNNRTLDMPVLVALNAADTAKIIENQTNEDILTDVVKTLKSMYPNATIPAQPREYYVTRWAQDPWARGSYSYFAVGNDKNITEVLAEPFGRLLFAGEATSSKPATVLGAYLSGIREGERLSELLKAKV